MACRRLTHRGFLQVLAAAGEDVEECSICGEPGEFAIDPESQTSESMLLRATFNFTVHVAERRLVASKCVVISFCQLAAFDLPWCHQSLEFVGNLKILCLIMSYVELFLTSAQKVYCHMAGYRV